MNTAIPTIVHQKVKALLDTLDSDIQHLHDVLVYLEDLRCCVIKRDDDGLGQLLDQIRIESDHHAHHEETRRQLRRDLADLLHYRPDELTLSALQEILPEPTSTEIKSSKEQLRTLTSQVRQEHLRTAWLLKDCTRFNHALFRAIFRQGKTQDLTYTAAGRTQAQPRQTMMNLRF